MTAPVFSRLATVAPDLVAWIGAADPGNLRRVAAEASAYAVRRTAVSEPAVDRALRCLLQPQQLDASLRQDVEQLVNELDEVQWDLQEKVDSGLADRDVHLESFARARAAAAVLFALDPDPRTAALEAVYEAHAATDDMDALRRLIASVLASEP